MEDTIPTKTGRGRPLTINFNMEEYQKKWRLEHKEYNKQYNDAHSIKYREANLLQKPHAQCKICNKIMNIKREKSHLLSHLKELFYNCENFDNLYDFIKQYLITNNK